MRAHEPGALAPTTLFKWTRAVIKNVVCPSAGTPALLTHETWAARLHKLHESAMMLTALIAQPGIVYQPLNLNKAAHPRFTFSCWRKRFFWSFET